MKEERRTEKEGGEKVEKILKGVKILDMCIAAAGPACSRMLMDFGAECVMLEPLDGQSTRYSSPHSFHFKCGGKKSISCNLKTVEGKQLFFDLIRWADVFVSNYRMKSLVKLGFSYEELEQLNPRLIYGIISAFGTEGSKKDEPGYDATAFWAKSGMALDIAQKGSIIQVPSGLGDFAAAQSLAVGICGALYAREKTGKGTKVLASLMASGIYLNHDAILESQYGKELPSDRTHAKNAMLNNYRCSDGKWISINAGHHWDVSWPWMCRTIGREDLIDKYPHSEDVMYEHAPEVVSVFDAGFQKMTQEEAYQALKKCSAISVEKLQHSIDVAKDPQAVANEFVFEWTDPNGKKIMHPATPVKIGDMAHVELPYGPELGENTIEIMQMLGYSETKITEYVRSGIVTAQMEK